MIEAVETFLFSILILGFLKNNIGSAWRREIGHFFVIEITLPVLSKTSATYQLLGILPSVFCMQPNDFLLKGKQVHVAHIDHSNLSSEEYQRVYQYLFRYENNITLENYQYEHSSKAMHDAKQFIQVISNHAYVKTWSDVHHYVKFLNLQLLACENSLFCNVGSEDGWRDFKQFIIRMMIQMSKEFTTSSILGDNTKSDKLKQYETGFSWNNGFHPYVFFNKDSTTFTFMGFSIDDDCNAIDPHHNKVVMKNVLSKNLMRLLKQSGVNLSDNYLTWDKEDLLEKLALVIGLEFQYEDPDPSYVITADNVMKMLAILMRFRCGIPIVMMGETGCGKTRLLRYLCNLASMDCFYDDNASNLIILKVHGGTTYQDIEKAVEVAEKRCNSGATLGIGTVLFFDEANTCDHIDLIKEIMCDRKIFGRTLHEDLKIVAACNPYRKHSQQMINKLESAGLGFFTKTSQARERLGMCII
jgi:hypothetical protein